MLSLKSDEQFTQWVQILEILKIFMLPQCRSLPWQCLIILPFCTMPADLCLLKGLQLDAFELTNIKFSCTWRQILLEDCHLMEKQANIDRERIPKYVVHARRTSSKGFFWGHRWYSSPYLCWFPLETPELRHLLLFSSPLSPMSVEDLKLSRIPEALQLIFTTER